MSAIIPGGYYIKARKIQQSDIAFAPPHVREVWDWLLKEANHLDNGKFKRGETMRSISDIREGLKWYSGSSKRMYSQTQCENAIKWLRKHSMIATQKTTRGAFITIVNYDFYQNPENYENRRSSLQAAEAVPNSSRTINKNDKNGRKEKEESVSASTVSFNISLEDFSEQILADKQYIYFDLKFYYEKIKNWALAKNAGCKDWPAMAKKFMLDDLQKGNAVRCKPENNYLIIGKAAP